MGEPLSDEEREAYSIAYDLWYHGPDGPAGTAFYDGFKAGFRAARRTPGPVARGGTVNSFWPCVCGATEGQPNPDCERCQLVTEILELRAQVLNPRPRLRGGSRTDDAGRWQDLESGVET